MPDTIPTFEESFDTWDGTDEGYLIARMWYNACHDLALPIIERVEKERTELLMSMNGPPASIELLEARAGDEKYWQERFDKATVEQQAEVERLREAGDTIVKAFDEGVFVRDVVGDDDPKWAMRLLGPIAALGVFARAAPAEKP